MGLDMGETPSKLNLDFLAKEELKMFGEIIQALGMVSFVILIIVVLLFLSLFVGQVIYDRSRTRRRYDNVWDSLRPNGYYKVKNVVWQNRSHFGLLIHYQEEHACGYAIYMYDGESPWEIPQEDDCLKVDEYGKVRLLTQGDP